jgi:hypothetical protein
MKPKSKNPAAVALGKLGGAACTPAQNAARKRNAKKGGWPKGRKRKPDALQWIQGKAVHYIDGSVTI